MIKKRWRFFALQLDKYSVFVASLGLFAYHALFLVMWKDSYFHVHDSNDLTGFLTFLGQPEIGWRLDSSVDQVMNGLSRGFFQFGFDLILVFSTLFKDVFYVYLVNQLLVHTFAFIGMYIFLMKLGQHYAFSKWVCAFVALNFALIPYLTWKGISIAGLPLLVWAFWSIIDRQNQKWAFAIIIFFPFYSSLAHIGVFVCLCAGLAFLIVSLRKRSIDWLFMCGVVILGLGYVISALPMLYTYILGDAVVHRLDWNLPSADFLENFWRNFSWGHYNSSSLHWPTLIIASTTLPILLFSKQYQQIFRLVKWLLFAALLSLIYAAYSSQLLLDLNQELNFSNFNWSRFHYFRALVWSVILALCLQNAVTFFQSFRFSWLRVLPAFLLLLQSTYTLRYNYEFFYTSYNLVQRIQGDPIYKYSYSYFFAEELYSDIRDFINRPQENYRIVNLGLHPSIAQHNGFYTLDSYQNLYLLDYKHKFRRIIAPELEKSPHWKAYFDQWGNRAYLISSELVNNNEAFLIDKGQTLTVRNWTIDTAALSELGGEYIFSAVQIDNASELNLTLLNIFEREKEAWRVYLYAVNDAIN